MSIHSDSSYKRSPSRGRSAHASEQTPTDELDVRIIMELERDSRRSYREIASQLRVSPSTVMSRIQKLQKEGVVKGYYAQLDHAMLGYDLTAITEIVVSKGKLLEMEREIAKLPGVCAVYDITGATDAIVIAKFRDREALSHLSLIHI